MEAISIYAIVVLYRCLPAESSSLKTLLRAASRIQPGTVGLKILVYDNTPERNAADHPEGVEYHAAGANVGLATAYNFACAQARGGGFEWLLTLDQDSHLPDNFLTAVAFHLEELRNQPKMGALVPQILCGGRVLSPYRLTMGGARARWFPEGFQGIPDEAVYALNSGSILRLSALRQAGDYDPRFWLDGSDTSVFHRMAERGKRVYIAGTIRIEHDFAMKMNRRRVSPDRYRSIIEAESAFCDLYLGQLASLTCTARLLARLLIYRKSGDRILRAIARDMIARRLLRSRRHRLQSWQCTQSPMKGALRGKVASRPRLSVCMATYNGESYVKEQICSILPQLGTGDELIVVDDASQDKTLERIASIQNRVIRIIRHVQNEGLIGTFEEAIRSATGDIIFMSDMDDIWSPEKVARILDVFRRRPEVTLVTTAVALIDEKGNPFEPPDIAKQPRFQSGLIANFLRNRYQGSAMAFRASLLPAILPLPRNKLFFHDVWIGLQNEIHGGKLAFIDEPLLLYRRHGRNLSRRLPRLLQIRLRFQLGWELAKSLLRRRAILAAERDCPEIWN